MQIKNTEYRILAQHPVKDKRLISDHWCHWSFRYDHWKGREWWDDKCSNYDGQTFFIKLDANSGIELVSTKYYYLEKLNNSSPNINLSVY